ncbi:MAG: hypothetical protein JG761_832 [Proteiniphilum sp.]|jgi:hypothetical protein|nr:hypothetical protein [Proteiniphilum sp.]
MLKTAFFCEFIILTNYSLIFATNSSLEMQNLYHPYTGTTTTMTMTPWGVR